MIFGFYWVATRYNLLGFFFLIYRGALRNLVFFRKDKNRAERRGKKKNWKRTGNMLVIIAVLQPNV